ncbi:hypothetical protein LINGRAHAP2_LOCUS23935 [Linum grandiflorum]
MNLEFEGQKFTWTNYREDDRNITVRLDRALCSPAWRIQFHKAILSHEAMIGSDHTPFYSTSKEGRNSLPDPFDTIQGGVTTRMRKWLSAQFGKEKVTCKISF